MEKRYKKYINTSYTNIYVEIRTIFYDFVEKFLGNWPQMLHFPAGLCSFAFISTCMFVLLEHTRAHFNIKTKNCLTEFSLTDLCFIYFLSRDRCAGCQTSTLIFSTEFDCAAHPRTHLHHRFFRWLLFFSTCPLLVQFSCRTRAGILL